MLSGSAIVRVSVLLIVAGLMAALTQFLWLRDGSDHGATVPHVAAPPTERPPPAPAEPPPGPVAEPAPSRPAPPQASAPSPAASPAQGLAPSAQGLAPPAQGLAPPAQILAPPAQVPPAIPAQPAFPPATGDAAGSSPAPRATALVDLNTGTLAELNGLRGGGTIGRAIMRGRPYASVDGLLSKRVLSRSTYERIREQVTVQSPVQ